MPQGHGILLTWNQLIPAGRLSKLINPSHIEQVFRRIGAKSGALATKETAEPIYASIYSCKYDFLAYVAKC